MHVRAAQAGNISINAKELHLNSSGMLHSTGQGYASHSGPGHGAESSYGGGNGASHGGSGGRGSQQASVVRGPYGGIVAPSTAGSGGGRGYRDGYAPDGGTGGGVISIEVAGVLTLEGASSKICADGLAGQSARSQSCTLLPRLKPAWCVRSD